MKLFLRAVLAAALVLTPMYGALAAVQVTPGTGESIGTVTCGSDKCAKHAVIDTTATQIDPATKQQLPASTGQQNSAGSLSTVRSSDPDQRDTSGTITVADTGSTTVAGQGSVTLRTGTPTAGSTYCKAINGRSSVAITVTGSFTATLQAETDADGATYAPRKVYIVGSDPTAVISTTLTMTAPGVFMADVQGMRDLCVRATAWTSTPTVQFTFSDQPLTALLPAMLAKQQDTANVGVNLNQINGSTIATGNGPATAGTVRQTPSDPEATYTASWSAIAPAASATDVFTLTGGAGKTLRLLRSEISCTQTTLASFTFVALKRSSANTGGTALTAVAHDSANQTLNVGAAKSYTANPVTPGTLVGNIRSSIVSVPSTAAADAMTPLVRDFSASPILIANGEVYAENFGGVTMTGGSCSGSFTWQER